MIKIDQLKLKITEDESRLKELIAKKLRLQISDIDGLEIIKKSIDARKKPEVFYVYSVSVKLSKDKEKKILAKFSKDNNISAFKAIKYDVPLLANNNTLSKSPIVVGSTAYISMTLCDVLKFLYTLKPESSNTLAIKLINCGFSKIPPACVSVIFIYKLNYY